jgi:hypothetical protein
MRRAPRERSEGAMVSDEMKECDGCGKRERGVTLMVGDMMWAGTPPGWLYTPTETDHNSIYVFYACSPECARSFTYEEPS